MMRAYYLDGGPKDGVIVASEADCLEVVAPRWPALGTAAVGSARIAVAHGWYRHDGSYRDRGEGEWLPVMRWGGFDR